VGELARGEVADRGELRAAWPLLSGNALWLRARRIQMGSRPVRQEEDFSESGSGTAADATVSRAAGTGSRDMPAGAPVATLGQGHPMRWYRALFWRFFRWFDSYEDRETGAAGYACILLGVLHIMNIVTAVEIWVRITGTPVRLSAAAGRYWPVLLLVTLAFCAYFLHALPRIKAEFSDADDRTGRSLAVGYLVASVGAFGAVFFL
jgi:hypothetical protein